MSGRCCGECAYWKSYGNESGICRRHSPRPTFSPDGQFLTIWAQVDLDDWCGDYGYDPSKDPTKEVDNG